MGIKNSLEKKYNEIINDFILKKAFKNDKRSVSIIVLKGKMNAVDSLYIDETSSFYVLEDKTTNIGDILVTEREKKYKICDIKPGILNLVVNEDVKEIEVIQLKCEEFINDPLSFINNINMSQSTDSQIVININNMSDSEISNFGNIVNKIDFSQNIEANWSKLKHDLTSCYHHKDYEKYVEMIDKTIKEKKNNVKWEAVEKVAKIAGVFIGEIIKGFTTALLDKYS